MTIVPTDPDKLRAYAGASTVFRKPPRIDDPENPKWRTEVEMGDLKLGLIEIAFCVDATGSMYESNEYVTTYLGTTVRLLRLMSEQVRAGTVYYRHEVDPELMQPCCKTALDAKGGFRTFTLPFTSDANALVAAMRARPVDRKAGHDGGSGAYCGGITAAVKDLKWTKGSRRIIATTGDAIVTTGTGPALVNIAGELKAQGIELLFIVKDQPQAKSVAAASLAATGRQPIVYAKDIAAMEKNKGASSSSPLDQFRGTAFESLVTQSIESALPTAYRDRGKPLFEAMFPIIQAQDAAERARK